VTGAALHTAVSMCLMHFVVLTKCHNLKDMFQGIVTKNDNLFCRWSL